MITPFDLIIVIAAIVAYAVTSICCTSLEKKFTKKYGAVKWHILFVSVVLAPFILFYVYAFSIYEPMNGERYSQYLGKYDRVISITSGKYPDVIVKTSIGRVTLSPRYIERSKPGDKIYYTVEGDGREISYYYKVGSYKYKTATCYYPMTCWNRAIEKFRLR